jgi:hypothetical protein
MISDGSAIVAAALSGSSSWYDGYATRETLSFEEEPQNDGHGSYLKPIISGFVPGEAASLISVMDSMPLYRFLVIIKDPLGRQRLVGSPVMPLNFSAKFGSGTARPDAKGFNFKFYGDSLNPAPVYNF